MERGRERECGGEDNFLGAMTGVAGHMWDEDEQHTMHAKSTPWCSSNRDMPPVRAMVVLVQTKILGKLELSSACLRVERGEIS
jgi:hypothetical protein